MAAVVLVATGRETLAAPTGAFALGCTAAALAARPDAGQAEGARVVGIVGIVVGEVDVTCSDWPADCIWEDLAYKQTHFASKGVGSHEVVVEGPDLSSFFACCSSMRVASPYEAGVYYGEVGKVVH